MDRLVDRLNDPARSGVYRVGRVEPVVRAVQGSGVQLTRVALRGVRDKQALLATLAQALDFPEWFGGNWDALEDCLTDLSWRKAGGQVIVLERAQHLAPDELGVLIDVLTSAAEFWRGRGRPFFAVFVNGPQSLPALAPGTGT